jgi:phenylpropionate dioxygenase-like ring-hydroxylating dioxygenase large terminal subunit
MNNMWLSNHWYPVLESQEVKGKPVRAERLGKQLVFWRDSLGTPHVQSNQCPHMGASLSQGKIKDDCLVCPFHGFAFDTEGLCQHIPANGKNGRIPPQMHVKTFSAQEAHGLIWIWYGDEAPTHTEVPFFEELQGLEYGTLTDQWPVHVSRAIENQLDSAHLPFVHHNTIGRRLSPFIQGPYVEADDHGIKVWNFQHLDADKQMSQEELRDRVGERKPDLHLKFPGVWRLKITPDFYQFIAFVPVNAESTLYYLRHYRRWRIPVLNGLISRALSVSNRVILNQDKRVVCEQRPINTAEADHEHLIGADRAIAQFRRWVKHLQNEAIKVPPEPSQ